MKHGLRKLTRIAALLLIICLVPIYASAATKKLDNDSTIDFGRGTYTLTLSVGDNPSLWYETSASLEIDAVRSSNTNVLKVTSVGYYFFDVKAKKPGKATISVKDENGYVTRIKVTVKPKKSTITATNYVYKNSKKVKVVAKNVSKGDVIRLKIGSKTYSKKIRKDEAKVSYVLKISKPGFYGKKYRLTLERKKKTVAKYSKYVYLSDTVYVGYTKKIVKWLTYWNNPVAKNTSAYSEQWCYDWDGDGYYDAYLYFTDGKVSNWTIYE